MRVNRLRLLVVTFMATAAMSLLASCEEDGEYVTLVSGYVTDSATAAPIDSAMLTWSDTTISIPDAFVTDSTGFYSIPLYGSNETLFVRKAGYKTAWRSLTNVTSNFSGVDFQLVKE